MNQNNPTLVIMAAGMGSRFGGLKQIEPVDPEGHIIIDFSLFDAWRAGFRDVVFIIKREWKRNSGRAHREPDGAVFPRFLCVSGDRPPAGRHCSTGRAPQSHGERVMRLPAARAL